ncbi:ribosome small subunit-dependent GTPase A [Dactylosporangium sp. CS-047395]|uniref:ribosome small subunit-dependent GTPase A n=1 Tax=Dactylosporangium sp. CS-047395 TaxID=3239936 RepID=UPI003D8C4A98
MSIDLSALGWDDGFAEVFGRFDVPGQRPARVSRVDRGVCTALTAGGPVRASVAGGLLARAAQDPRAMPCAGDWLVVRDWPDDRITAEFVLPRRAAIVRATAGEESFGQVLAANIDAVAVVEPVDPSPDPGRIERLLALAWESGAKPHLVLTKADLAADPEALAAQMPGHASGVTVHAVSARTGLGLDGLRPLVAHGRTLGLLGQSGAGKSSLVNALAGAPVMQTRALRSDGRGRHTTTYRALIPMPDGGAVLDTPGVRLVGMFDTVAGLDRAFADVTLLARGCRFDDCGHGDEPGCAVRTAVEEGELSPRRYASWQKLQKEQKLASVRRQRRENRERRRPARG